jgi:Tol biopolymer transport system component
MSFTIGSRLGRYVIQSPIGSGGTGDVYRASDTTLNREVAIKVLSDLWAADPEQLARFDREARLLAALNHPHIAQVYGFEDLSPTDGAQGGVRAIVMELVDGPTLADRIAGGRLSIEDALSIAQQIAEALETAHERGIVHRDLKPANIKLTPGGTVKVLDFGLAKASGAVVGARTPSGSPIGWDGHQLTPEAMNSPTVASPATESGVVLGTVAYMAPEQARGKPVDKRADIWAFGVVLYEMLCGRRPFEGETFSDMVAAVLRQDVDWTPLPPDTPDDLRSLLRHCLERDWKNRLRDAGDARLAITDALRPRAATSAGNRPLRARWPWVAAVVAGAALLGAFLGRTLFTHAAAPVSPTPIVRFAIEPPAEVMNVSNVTVAADGRFIVYEGQVEGESRLFLRWRDGLDSRQLPGTAGARWPFISPDGEWVGFFREGKIYRVAIIGGDALPVCDVRGGPGAIWNRDGRIVFSRTWLSGLSAVSAEGGTPTILTTPDPRKREIGHWWPSVLPDGRILFTVVTATTGFNDSRIAILDPATGHYDVLFPGARASWLPSGHIVFYRIGRYLAVPFDLPSKRVTGEPFPVLDGALELDPLGDWPQPVSVSPSGALAYLAGSYVPPSRLTWIDIEGRSTPLTFAARPFVSVKLSPDDRRAATASLEGGRLLIRLLDLERGTEEAPQIDGMNWNPTWLPDGRLSYTSMRKGDFDVYVKDADGTGAEHAVLTGPDDTDSVAWTRDGRLVLQGSEPDGAYPLKLFDPRRPGPAVRLTKQHVENGGSLSPDDRWLVYQSAATGRPLIYARALTGPGPAVPLSPNAGEFPLFLRDGRTLVFLRGHQLVVVPWHDRNGRFEIGPEHKVTQLTYGSGWMYGAPYDAATDGRLLVLVRTEAPPPLRIRVVLGWDREVASLASRERH